MPDKPGVIYGTMIPAQHVILGFLNVPSSFFKNCAHVAFICRKGMSLLCVLVLISQDGNYMPIQRA